MHVAAAGAAGLGHQRAENATPVPGTGAGPSRRPARARSAIPVATSRQPADAVASAASRRSRVSSPARSSRLVHTWLRSPPGLHHLRLDPRLTVAHPRTSGPARASAPVHGSRSTNSSSTPSVIPPAALAAPGGPPSTETSGPVPRGLGTAGHPAGLGAAGLILPPVPGSPKIPAGVPQAAARPGPMPQNIVCSRLI